MPKIVEFVYRGESHSALIENLPRIGEGVFMEGIVEKGTVARVKDVHHNFAEEGTTGMTVILVILE